MKPKNFIYNILFLCIVGGIIFSASSSPPVNTDPYTGLYFVHGTKIVTYYRCPFIDVCGPGDGPFIDTTYFASVVAVKLMQEKADTLLFFGLPGGDEGDSRIYFGRDQIRDHASSILHYDGVSGHRIYGSHSGNTFTIQHSRAGLHYNATGNISNHAINIQGEFTYRTITVDYDLVGEKF